MYKCNRCGYTFDEPLIVDQKLSGPWEDSYPGDEVCPKCEREDFDNWDEEADSAKRAFSEVRKSEVLWEICDTDIPALLAHIKEQDKKIAATEKERDANLWAILELNKRIAELERAQELAKRNSPMLIEVTEDDERFCPACHEYIAGYYASYCEYCGQCLDMSPLYDETEAATQQEEIGNEIL